MNRQEQLDRQWHETGYEELGIGFAHDQPISAKEDMNGLIDHKWIRKTRATRRGQRRGAVERLLIGWNRTP